MIYAGSVSCPEKYTRAGLCIRYISNLLADYLIVCFGLEILLPNLFDDDSEHYPRKNDKKKSETQKISMIIIQF